MTVCHLGCCSVSRHSWGLVLFRPLGLVLPSLSLLQSICAAWVTALSSCARPLRTNLPTAWTIFLNFLHNLPVVFWKKPKAPPPAHGATPLPAPPALHLDILPALSAKPSLGSQPKTPAFAWLSPLPLQGAAQTSPPMRTLY